MPGPVRPISFFLVSICSALLAAAFAIDLLLAPTGGPMVLYVGIVLLGLRSADPRAIWILATASTLLAVLGKLQLSEAPEPFVWPILIQRGFGIAGIWLIAFFAARHHRSIAAHGHGEAELCEREAKLQAILDTAPLAVVTIDSHGRIESFNPIAESLFGYSVREVFGRNVNLLMPAPYREQHDGYMHRYLTTGERRIIGIGRVVKGRRKDGTVFPMELSVGEVRLNGSPRFVGFIQDLSARERMEQELRQSQKMEAVGQLSGGIAHDFNNLLTVILGNLEMLETRLAADDPKRHMVREAMDTALLGAQLTERLLAFARRQPLDPRPVDMHEQIAVLAGVLRRTLSETVEVRTLLGPNLPKVLVDPAQLQSAVLNLALNARDAMPAGGLLTLEVSETRIDADYARLRPETRPGNYVMVVVSDTGAGMSPHVRERAFEPFFTTKPAGSGTGLGLSMVYGFVKQSRGHIELYSEIGHGTTVKLYLPRAPEAARAVTAPAPIGADMVGHGERILVVEDDARVRRLTVTRLQDLGYVALEAEDGAAALRILADDPQIDLLFTDMVMPGSLTGIELAHLAKERRPKLAVIITSGYAEPDSVAQGLAEGAVWLRKPYTASDLAGTLRRLLGPQAKS
jgi:PAS domain S-box-containing protein